ncbi:MAG: cytochrome [Fibrobacteres bacterium]|nr:cytochrome [Fibrobacterota bacterium]
MATSNLLPNRPSAAKPALKGSRLLGLLPSMRKDPIGVLLEARDLGDVVPLDFRIRKVFQVNHPDLVKRVLQDNRANYPKSVLYEKMRPAFGNGLLLSEGDFWAVQRRLIQPAFAHHRLEGMTRLMVSETLARVPILSLAAEEKRIVDIADEMSALTLSIVVKAMFGTELKEDMSAIAHAVETLNEHSNHRFYSVIDLPLWVPTPRNLEARGALEHLESVVYRIIRERRKAAPAASENSDLLDMLLSARYDDGSAMPERQVRDEVMTIFLAGHETTATSLAWTLMLLDENPIVEENLRAEFHAVLGERDPVFADMPRLPYLKSVLEESMRVRPPVWVFSRTALADDMLGDCRIPKGTAVMLSPYAMHRDPRYWEDPEAFQPERFAAGEAEKRPRYAYFPFGGGPRICVGSGFAMAEGALVLACLLRRFRFKKANPGPVGMKPLVTLRPRGGMPMFVSAM